MANSTSGFFETQVLPAAATLQAPLMFSKAALSHIAIAPKPVPGRVGHTVNVNIPTVDEGNVWDIGGGPIVVTDEKHGTVALTVDHKESVARKIVSWDQSRTPVELKQFYMAPMVEELLRKINRRVCDLITSANFNQYSSVAGGADTFDRADLAEMWRNLIGAGVPINPSDVCFLTSHVPYSNMISTSDWIQEAIVAAPAAEAAQQRAQLAPAYGFSIVYDQQSPVPSSGTYAGLAFHRNAIVLSTVTDTDDRKDGVDETTFQIPGTGLTVYIQTWYDPVQQGRLLHMYAMFGVKVVRPDYGSYGVTT